MLVPTLAPRVFLAPANLTAGVTGLVAIAALVPGLLAMRRAAAAMVLITGWQRTRSTCRRAHAGLIAAARSPPRSHLFESAESAEAQPTHARAFSNIRIHGLWSNVHSRGCQDSSALRNTRSGCGIMIVSRPSAVVSAATPPGEPFGFAG